MLCDLTKEGAILDKELVQGVLYDRILQHIRDAKARKLAHPGLVLRRVTWRLIRDVLANPCELGQVDESEARRLWAALGDEVWLVDRDAKRSDVLIHRSDIRRLMLRLMAKDELGRTPPRTAKRSSRDQPAPRTGAAVARDIHRRALAYYTDRRDPSDVVAIAEAEAFYHRMMLVDHAGAASVLRRPSAAI